MSNAGTEVCAYGISAKRDKTRFLDEIFNDKSFQPPVEEMQQKICGINRFAIVVRNECSQ